jgi:hypothetical protein
LALQKLPKFSIDYPLPIQASILRTHGIALSKLGYLEDSIKIRLQLDDVYQQMLPQKMAARAYNHQIIWSSLQAAPDEVLELLAREFPVMEGWIALSHAVKSSSEEGINRDLAIAAWQRHYPEHPAGSTLAKTLRSHKNLITKYPSAIALLLPLTSRYAGPATAIRDGLMAAYYRHDAASKPEIRIYDTGESQEQVLAAYKTAVEDGAKLIIGPLQKDAVADLIRNKLSIPVLALNYAPDEENSAQVIQFGLSPEDEARQAAELTIIKDQAQAIIFAPNTNLGDRLVKAYTERFEELGGNVLSTEKYIPNSSDHKHSIQRSMNILQSRNRHAILSSVIKQKTEFEPRRRQDVDAIFLVVDPKQARNLRSQLKFYDAGDISVYATSKAFTGSVNKQRDNDLNGLIFSDMPWILQGEHNQQFAKANELWPKILSRYPRLYALGLDAYRIIPYLARLQANQFERFPGLTGSIAINEFNRAHREMVWANFVNGQPEVLEFSSLKSHSLADIEDDISYLPLP